MKDSSLEVVLYNKPGHLIRRLQQIATTVFLEETAEFDTTPVQYGALAAIRAYPGTDQLRVAQAIGFDRNTISGVVERLETKGLISRETGTDRRTKLLYLTAEGEALLEQMYASTERAQERMLTGLTKAERKQFVDMLKRVVDANNEVSRVPVSVPASVPARRRS
ncbi:MarR family transcriptional regulator [Cupriavidus taiwanensis]|uniref:Transcriptional regulator MarR family protein n=1 Tax=Cupriavidus taiwanensis TaxID=164546 RepID=A0A976A4T4_9BURK|nr:MarR family transcriptional regulator [Cupriavidus taiwanensis]MDK3025891.1 MarR family transcriptional regulator [Cupriavidus taiwanensis]NSX13054.1 MarR family transcriptional regulator [Cupriavidus taiwanensis]SOY61062.1 Transcriptional regulator MarR family protein [Cupriavidus taiwanensis]